MIKDLYEKFLPQFVELARVRMERAQEAVLRPEIAAMTVVIRELHAIAGEAGLLGLAPIVPLARQAEERAKRLRESTTDTDRTAFAGALAELKGAIEVVEASIKREGTP